MDRRFTMLMSIVLSQPVSGEEVIEAVSALEEEGCRLEVAEIPEIDPSARMRIAPYVAVITGKGLGVYPQMEYERVLVASPSWLDQDGVVTSVVEKVTEFCNRLQEKLQK